MKNGFLISLGIFTGVTLAAGQPNPKPQSYEALYARAGLLSTQGNLRAFGGGRVLTPVFELGYSAPIEDLGIGYGVYGSYFALRGKEMPNYDGMKQDLYGYRLGVDLRYETGIPSLTPYVGLSWNFYDGQRKNRGVFHDTSNGTNYSLPAGPYTESRGKIGARLGLEYRINAKWGVVVDYNFSEWMSQRRNLRTREMGQSGPNYADGVNPVRPSWVALSVQYRFSKKGL